MKFSIKDFLVTFTEKIYNGKLHFWPSAVNVLLNILYGVGTSNPISLKEGVRLSFLLIRSWNYISMLRCSSENNSRNSAMITFV